MKKQLEILAPAGNREGVTAAINGGANAVYFGAKRFNARQKADNFDSETMADTISLCHDHNVKVYVTLNTLIKDCELQDALEEALACYEVGADALIVQDPGLIYLLRQYYSEISLQTSTQGSVFGIAGVRFFEKLGFSRVVLPREMTIDEIKSISERTQIELKVFGHGALCYAYSGQCLFSSMIGGRSGNRGLCAQPCRKKYRLKDIDGRILKEGYLMSMMDLNTCEDLDQIMDAGVASLKIEGRMKSPAYIYAASKAYRQRVDGNTHDIYMDSLTQVFNRSFTKGWILKDENRLDDTMGRNRGVVVGKILSYKNNQIILRLNEGVKLHKGDGLSFGLDASHGFKVSQWEEKKGNILLPLPTYQKQMHGIIPGMTVYRTLNAALMADLSEKAAMPVKQKTIPIGVTVNFKKDTFVWGEVRIDHKKIRFQTDVMPVCAEKKPMTKELILTQLTKLGDTSYELGDLQIALDEALFLPKSGMNAVRRQMIAVIDQEIRNNGSLLHKQDLIKVSEVLDMVEKQKVEKPIISLSLPDIEFNGCTLENYLSLDADEFVLPWDWDLEKLEKRIISVKNADKRVMVSLPRVMHTQEDDRFERNMVQIIDLPGDGFLLPHYEGLSLLQNKDLNLEADIGLHFYNQASGVALSKWGCSSGVLSPEMTGLQAEAIAANVPLDCTMIVYGRQEMMISRNCLLNCKEKKCATCQNHQMYCLEDAHKAVFPCYRNAEGTTRIFNADKLFNKNPWHYSHIGKWRIDVLDESLSELEAAIRYFRSEGESKPDLQRYYAGRYTSGNLKREII